MKFSLLKIISVSFHKPLLTAELKKKKKKTKIDNYFFLNYKIVENFKKFLGLFQNSRIYLFCACPLTFDQTTGLS